MAPARQQMQSQVQEKKTAVSAGDSLYVMDIKQKLHNYSEAGKAFTSALLTVSNPQVIVRLGDDDLLATT